MRCGHGDRLPGPPDCGLPVPVETGNELCAAKILLKRTVRRNGLRPSQSVCGYATDQPHRALPFGKAPIDDRRASASVVGAPVRSHARDLQRAVELEHFDDGDAHLAS